MKKTLKFPQDKIMQKLFVQIAGVRGELPVIIPAPSERYFSDLCEIIIGQQLSVKVADTIMARLLEAQKGVLVPEKLIAEDIELLRKTGISYAKAEYIKNLAEFWTKGKIKYPKFSSLPDGEIIRDLVKVKGVGKWTAEMFLIFTLGRPDVFSSGDYGLKKAIIKLYRLPQDIDPKSFEELSQNWRPNRSTASRVLWKSLEL